MFDVEVLIEECKVAVRDADPRGAVRDVVARTVERPGDVAAVLGKTEGGIDVVYESDDLTILNVVWAPHMTGRSGSLRPVTGDSRRATPSVSVPTRSTR